MSRTVIAVENLGKKYSIRHRQTRQPYVALRDVIADKAKSLIAGRNDELSAVEDFWALRNISFQVKEGDVVGIIGRNGAGKSTLLKILSRITEPTEGRIGIRGRVASLLEVGTGFHPELTGRENIYLNGAILGMTREEIKRKFDEIVAFAEIEKFLDTPVKRYSSGMYMRLAFAVAAHLDPEILIVDEVLAVGDAEFQKKCLGKMSEIADHGRTVIFVSHNMSAIVSFTGRVILFNQGNAVFDGDTEDGIARYLSSMSNTGASYKGDKQEKLHYISRIELSSLGENGVHVSGSTLKIKVTIQSTEAISRGCLSIQVVNENFQPVLHLRAYDHQFYFGRKSGETRLVCEVPNCSLNVGKYSLNVFLSGPPGSDLYEHLNAVCAFDVDVKHQIALWGWRPSACSYIVPEVWSVER